MALKEDHEMPGKNRHCPAIKLLHVDREYHLRGYCTKCMDRGKDCIVIGRVDPDTMKYIEGSLRCLFCAQLHFIADEDKDHVLGVFEKGIENLVGDLKL